MPDDTVSVSAKCPCGEGLTWPEDATEDTPLVCKNCGADLGTYGDFQRKAIDAVKDRVESMFKDAFKRR